MSDLSLNRPVDARTLHFQPLGLGGALPPDVSDGLLTAQMAELTLPAEVPVTVRDQFDRLKDLYRAGLFTYEHFTHAERDAYRVLEVALKVRFVQHYADGLPLITDSGTQVRQVSSWDDVQQLLGRSRRGTRYRLAGHRRFNGSLAALIRWARVERYLYGQRNRGREAVMVWLRNELTHTDQDELFMPPDVHRTIRIVFEMICRLWEHDLPEGLAYRAPRLRRPWVVGLGPHDAEAIWFQVEALPVVADDKREQRAWYVALALDDMPHLGSWRPDVEVTALPVRAMWGPGSWEQLQAEVAHSAGTWRGDPVDILDRLFYIRVVDGVAQLPRSEDQVQALRERLTDERWFVVRADRPGDALAHVRGVLAGSCRPQGWCPTCPAQGLTPGARRETVDRFIRVDMPALPGPRRSTPGPSMSAAGQSASE